MRMRMNMVGGRRGGGGEPEREREHGNYMKDSVNMIITQLPLSLSLAPHNYSTPSNFFTLFFLDRVKGRERGRGFWLCLV